MGQPRRFSYPKFVPFLDGGWYEFIDIVKRNKGLVFLIARRRGRHWDSFDGYMIEQGGALWIGQPKIFVNGYKNLANVIKALQRKCENPSNAMRIGALHDTIMRHFKGKQWKRPTTNGK